MTSQRRIEANRRNALLSTGPRTPEGKARSRMNGLRHGARRASLLADAEDAAGFRSHRRAMLRELAPATPGVGQVPKGCLRHMPDLQGYR